MSIQQNVDYIKEEMKNDEKMLEGLLRLESWFRKYKKTLIVLVSIIIIAVVGYVGNSYYKEHKQQHLAFVYEQAIKGDEKAVLELKDSKSRLYDLYVFQNAIKDSNVEALKVLSHSKDPMIARLSAVQSASLQNNLKELDSKEAGDIGYLQAAFLEIKVGNLQQSKEILTKIPNDSPIKDLANALEHLSIKGIQNAN